MRCKVFSRFRAFAFTMKIAISGKGGSGKTTIAAGLIKILVEKNKSVIALDCDPDISLGLALDFPAYNEIKPISRMKDLIFERTGVDPAHPQGFFQINPKVDDIPERFCPQDKGIRLIVMGKVDKPQGVVFAGEYLCAFISRASGLKAE